MNTPCKFYSFLRATGGNWRNAIFISCDCEVCPHEHEKPCSGFLFTVDECGQVMLLSAESVHQLTGEQVDPAECSAVLPRRSFQNTLNGTRRTRLTAHFTSFALRGPVAAPPNLYPKRRHCAVFGAFLEVMIL